LAQEENAGFNFGLLDQAACAADDRFERRAAGLRRLFRRRKFDLPEIEFRIAKRDARDVAARFFSEPPTRNFGFAIRIGKTQCEDFVGNEFVAGKYVGPWKLRTTV
jgi:hypothetical protein